MAKFYAIMLYNVHSMPIDEAIEKNVWNRYLRIEWKKWLCRCSTPTKKKTNTLTHTFTLFIRVNTRLCQSGDTMRWPHSEHVIFILTVKTKIQMKRFVLYSKSPFPLWWSQVQIVYINNHWLQQNHPGENKMKLEIANEIKFEQTTLIIS